MMVLQMIRRVTITLMMKDQDQVYKNLIKNPIDFYIKCKKCKKRTFLLLFYFFIGIAKGNHPIDDDDSLGNDYTSIDELERGK